MKLCTNMIDDKFVIINDMGTAPIVAAMIEVLGIPNAINSFMGQPDSRTKVDTGTAIKALIVNMLYGRTPLVHVEESFKHVDCEVLFGKGLVAADFSDDCLGKSLEILGQIDSHKLYSQMCLRALEIHNVGVEKIHVDTTNISVYGEYDTPQAKDFEITYGDPKSKRKEFKQLNIGLYAQQNGFPIGGNALSGNKSDVIWFREALEELHGSFCGDIDTMPICIFDAAGSNEEMFKKANNLSVPTIIRLSDRFKITSEHIAKAWEEDTWNIVDNKGKILGAEPNKNFYKLRSFETHFDGFEWRLIVAYSSELKDLKESTAKRNFPKHKERIIKLIKKLSSIAFQTAEEANKAGKTFVDKNIRAATPFKYEMNIEEKVTEKYVKRGKPTQESEKTTTLKYHVNLSIGERDEELYKEWLKQESCFVLVSNVPKERCNVEQLFSDYKDQWLVEDKFKFLKQPVVLGPIWLQKPERIKGLVFVLLLAVLVNMYICFRVAASLEGNVGDTTSDGTPEDERVSLEHKETNGRKDNNPHLPGNKDRTLNFKLDSSTQYKKKLRTTDGRLVAKPSYKVIKQLLVSMKTLIQIDSTGEEYRKFAYGTEGRMLDLVIKIGFDPIIYLEQFSPHMDLWRYHRK